jgi:mRNA interferase RelE/StbE
LAWTVRITQRAEKQLETLDPPIKRHILRFMRERVEPGPYALGETMVGNWAGYRRYRVGDYRVVCRIEDEQLVVLVVRVGHRRDVYRRGAEEPYGK